MPCTRTRIPLRSIPAGDGHVVLRKTLQYTFMCAAVIGYADRPGLAQNADAVAEKYGPVPTEIGASGEEGQLLLAIRSGDVDAVARFLDAGITRMLASTLPTPGEILSTFPAAKRRRRHHPSQLGKWCGGT